MVDDAGEVLAVSAEPAAADLGVVAHDELSAGYHGAEVEVADTSGELAGYVGPLC